MDHPSPSPSPSSKRKRRGDEDRRPSKPRTAAAAEDGTQVTDDEVEEFFAILHRMRDASPSIARPGPRWSPAFAWEDFLMADAAKGDGASCGRAERSAAEAPRCLDLNADPEPEGVAVASPRGEHTARLPVPSLLS